MNALDLNSYSDQINKQFPIDFIYAPLFSLKSLMIVDIHFYGLFCVDLDIILNDFQRRNDSNKVKIQVSFMLFSWWALWLAFTSTLFLKQQKYKVYRFQYCRRYFGEGRVEDGVLVRYKVNCIIVKLY